MEKLDQSTKKDKRNEKKKNEKNATTQEKIRVKQDNQEIRKLFKQAGAELGQAHLKLELELNFT